MSHPTAIQSRINYLSVFLVLSLCTLSLSAYAGGVRIVGSGGDVIKCQTSEGFSYKLLDLYEGETIDQQKADFNNLSGSPFERAQQLAERLAGHGPLLSEVLKQHIERIEHNIIYLKDQKIEDVPDSYHSFSPRSKCKILQAAVQTLPDLKTGEPSYYVSELIWQQLDLNQRASLILHEAIFSVYLNYNSQSNGYLTEASARLAQNSSSVRELTWLLISNKIQSLRSLDYLRLLLYGGLEGAGEVSHLLQNVPSEIGLEEIKPQEVVTLETNRFYTLSLHPRKGFKNYVLRFSDSRDLKDVLKATLKSSQTHGFAGGENIFISYKSLASANGPTKLIPRGGLKNALVPYYEPNRLSITTSHCVNSNSRSLERMENPINREALELAQKNLRSLERFSQFQSQQYQQTLDKVLSQIKWRDGIQLHLATKRTLPSGSCAHQVVLSVMTHGVHDFENIEDRYQARFLRGMNPKLILGDRYLWSSLSTEQRGLILTQLTLMLHIPGLRHGTGVSHYSDDPAQIALRWAQILNPEALALMSDKAYFEEMHRWDLPLFISTASVSFRSASRITLNDKTNSTSLKQLGFVFDDQGQFSSWQLSPLPLNFFWTMIKIYNPQDPLNVLNTPIRIYKSEKNPQWLLFDNKPFKGCGALAKEKALILTALEETHSFTREEHPCDGF